MIHVVAIVAYCILAAQADSRPQHVDENLLRAFDQVESDVRRLGDWSQQSALIRESLHKIWQRSGWNEEADQYALKVTAEVSDIPPWDFPARMDKFTGMLAERYRLNDEQKSRVTSLFYQESFGFFLKNAKVVIEQARDVVGSRVRGEPFTPEQVAGWARQSGPLMADGTERVLRIAETMRKDMSPEQRETLERDMASFERRGRHMEKMRVAWSEGRWRPEDWGIEADPIQNGLAPAQTESETQESDTQKSAPAAAVAAGPTRLLPHDETTWIVYVRQFVARYRFDSAQHTAADSILAELVERAAQYRREHEQQISSVPLPARMYDPALAPIRRIFEDLKTRLTALPTGAQRALAGS